MNVFTLWLLLSAPPCSIPQDAGKPQIDAAINKGLEYLRSNLDSLEDMKAGPSTFSRHGFVLWTFIRAGVPASDPDFKKLFDRMMSNDPDTTYEAAVQAVVLEEIDRAKYRWRILRSAQFFVDNQCPDGKFPYGKATPAASRLPEGERKLDPKTALRSPKPRITRAIMVRKTKEGWPYGDNSNSGFAALGILACHQAGIRFPREMLALAERHWHSTSGPGWNYGVRTNATGPYGSTTAMGTTSLVIYGFIKNSRGSWDRDPHVKAGFKWLEDRFSVDRNPERPASFKGFPLNQHYFDYFAALERLSTLTGRKTYANRDWYAEGVAALLPLQREDGRFLLRGIDGKGINWTCHAIHFLSRSSRPLKQ